jgi:hypothetical protein
MVYLAKRAVVTIRDKDISFYQVAVDAILLLTQIGSIDRSDCVHLRGRLADIAIYADSMRTALLSAEGNSGNMSIAELRMLLDTMTVQDKRALKLMLE